MEVKKKVGSVTTILKIMLGFLKNVESISELSNNINKYEEDPKTTVTKDSIPVSTKEQPETL